MQAHTCSRLKADSCTHSHTAAGYTCSTHSAALAQVHSPAHTAGYTCILTCTQLHGNTCAFDIHLHTAAGLRMLTYLNAAARTHTPGATCPVTLANAVVFTFLAATPIQGTYKQSSF